MSEFPSVIDLFAGAGGLSLGFHKAGLKGVFAVEKDAMAFETLRRNLISDSAPYKSFPEWPEWLPKTPLSVEDLLEDLSIREHLTELRGKVSIIAGGPPCQGFSVGGSRNGLDERNQLVFKMLQVIGLVRPRIAVVENVEGITRRFIARPGEESTTSVADQVVAQLESMGYDAGFRVLDTSEFGVPQVRRRTVIIGLDKSVALSPDDFFDSLHALRRTHLEDLGLTPDRPTSAFDALEDLNNARSRRPAEEWPKFETSVSKRTNNAYARLMRAGIPSGAVPDSHRFSKHGPKVSALFAAAHATQPPGRLSKAFLVANDCKSDKKVLIDPSLPVSTLTSHPDEFIHYAEPRSITVREMARLQSFPDDFVFTGRYTINGDRRGLDVARCVQVGNAVPPLFAQALGTALMQALTQ